jgi:hypothetical protein
VLARSLSVSIVDVLVVKKTKKNARSLYFTVIKQAPMCATFSHPTSKTRNALRISFVFHIVSMKPCPAPFMQFTLLRTQPSERCVAPTPPPPPTSADSRISCSRSSSAAPARRRRLACIEIARCLAAAPLQPPPNALPNCGAPLNVRPNPRLRALPAVSASFSVVCLGDCLGEREVKTKPFA